jgi:hypothetical protein
LYEPLPGDKPATGTKADQLAEKLKKPEEEPAKEEPKKHKKGEKADTTAAPANGNGRDKDAIRADLEDAINEAIKAGILDDKGVKLRARMEELYNVDSTIKLTPTAAQELTGKLLAEVAAKAPGSLPGMNDNQTPASKEKR